MKSESFVFVFFSLSGDGIAMVLTENNAMTGLFTFIFPVWDHIQNHS